MPPPLPPSDAQVYARQLFEKCHGYPLWNPEPYGRSEAYRAKGVRVGDVGYVTKSGDFETLFNICLDANDPANYNGVPPNFVPLNISKERRGKTPFYHQQNSRIVHAKNDGWTIGVGAGATDPVLQLVSASADVQYTWRTSEGAILHLPNGATRFQSPPGLFRNYIKQHAHSWDTFINETLQCHLPPGSICLVTACDKTDEWMVGSFHQESTDREVSLQVSSVSLIEGHVSFAYHWDRTSPLVCRDHIQRNERTPAVTNVTSGDETHCVFVQGFRISVRKKRGSRNRKRFKVKPIEESHPEENIRQHASFPRLNRKSSSKWTFETASTTHEGTSGHQYSSYESNDTPLRSSYDLTSEDSIIMEDMYDSPPDWHPSAEWNECLLDAFPDAEIAFTHDTDIFQLNKVDQEEFDDILQEAVYEDNAVFWSFDGEECKTKYFKDEGHRERLAPLVTEGATRLTPQRVSIPQADSLPVKHWGSLCASPDGISNYNSLCPDESTLTATSSSSKSRTAPNPFSHVLQDNTVLKNHNDATPPQQFKATGVVPKNMCKAPVLKGGKDMVLSSHTPASGLMASVPDNDYISRLIEELDEAITGLKRQISLMRHRTEEMERVGLEIENAANVLVWLGVLHQSSDGGHGQAFIRLANAIASRLRQAAHAPKGFRRITQRVFIGRHLTQDLLSCMRVIDSLKTGLGLPDTVWDQLPRLRFDGRQHGSSRLTRADLENALPLLNGIPQRHYVSV